MHSLHLAHACGSMCCVDDIWPLSLTMIWQLMQIFKLLSSMHNILIALTMSHKDNETHNNDVHVHACMHGVCYLISLIYCMLYISVLELVNLRSLPAE